MTKSEFCNAWDVDGKPHHQIGATDGEDKERNGDA
jgi:hypothetical protein